MTIIEESIKANPFSAFLYKVTGLGFKEEREALNTISATGKGFPLYQWTKNRFTVSDAIDLAAKLSGGYAVEAGPGIYALRQQVEQHLGKFVDEQVNLMRKAKRIPEIDETKFRAVEDLVLSWRHFKIDIEFCLENKMLIDVDRLEFLHHFAKIAANNELPGASAVGKLVDHVSRHVFAQLPSKAVSLPSGFNTLRLSQNAATDDPEGKAKSYLECMGKHNDQTNESLFHFASKYRRTVFDRSGHSFALEMDNLVHAIIQKELEKLPRKQHGKLLNFAVSLRHEADRIVAEHEADIKIVEDFDAENEASCKKAVNAISRIERRSDREITKIAQTFVDKYKAAEHKRFSSELSERPLKKFSYEEIDSLLPAVKSAQLEVTLEKYIAHLRIVRKGVTEDIFTHKLATGGSYHSYLEPIGINNAYRTLANAIEAEINREHAIWDEEKFLNNKMSGIWGRIGDKRLNLIEERLNSFDRLRRAIHNDLKEMFTGPITQGKFDHMVGNIEMIKSASQEVYVHCANAIIFAWDQIPKKRLILKMSPDDYVIRLERSPLLRNEHMSQGPRIRR